MDVTLVQGRGYGGRGHKETETSKKNGGQKGTLTRTSGTVVIEKVREKVKRNFVREGGGRGRLDWEAVKKKARG